MLLMAKLVDVGSIGSYLESLSDPRHTRNRNGKRDVLAQVIQERDCLNAAEAETAICAFEKEVRRPGAVK
jgi:hypothetical protein